MKKSAHFREGPKLFFGFQKRGVGQVRTPARAQRQEEASFYLSSFAMHCTVPVRIPSNLAPTAGGLIGACCDLTSLERQLAPRPRRT